MIDIYNFYLSLNTTHHFLSKGNDRLMRMINKAQQGMIQCQSLGLSTLTLEQTNHGLSVTLSGLPNIFQPQDPTEEWGKRTPLKFVCNNLETSDDASVLNEIMGMIRVYMDSYSDIDFKIAHEAIELGLRRRLEADGNTADWFNSKVCEKVSLLDGPILFEDLHFRVLVEPKVVGGTLIVTPTGFCENLGRVRYPDLRL